MKIFSAHYSRRITRDVTLHSHDDYELHYIVEGIGWMDICGEFCDVRQGSFLISFPNERHRLMVSERCKYLSQYRIMVQVESLAEKELFNSLYKQFRNAAPVQTAMAQLLYRIVGHYESGDATRRAAAEYLLKGFIYELSGPRDCQRPEVEKALAFMRANVMKKLTLDDICRQVNLEKSYFSRIFKCATGHSPLNYFMKLKIDLAKELLLGGYSNSETAAKLSFADEFHFSRSFKRIAGESPRVFRNQAGLQY